MPDRSLSATVSNPVLPKSQLAVCIRTHRTAVLVLNERLAKDPTPQTLANEIGRLLNGKSARWDVDNFESHRIRDPQLNELWRRSMLAGPHPCPEEWVGLDEEHKDRLREIIQELRTLGQARDAGRSEHK